MAAVKWIKITTDMFDDEKIDFIESLPDADGILVIWVKILTLAGKCNAGGYILLTENIPYTDEMLAHKFRRQVNTVRLALETFRKLDMMQMDEKGLFITNWIKHQNQDGLEKIKEQTRKRVAKYRESQKQLNVPSNVTSNVTVTQGNATDIDIELELDKDIDKDIYIMSATEKVFIDLLKKIKNYPLDITKDIEMYKNLEERYPKLDLIESIKDFANYKLDKPLKKKSNARSQITNSFKNYVKWEKNIKKRGENNGYNSNNDKREGVGLKL